MIFTANDLEALARHRKGVIIYDECFMHDESNSGIQVALLVCYELGGEDPRVKAVWHDGPQGYVQLPLSILPDPFLNQLENLL